MTCAAEVTGDGRGRSRGGARVHGDGGRISRPRGASEWADVSIPRARDEARPGLVLTAGLLNFASGPGG